MSGRRDNDAAATRYGGVARMLHWIVAGAIALQFLLAQLAEWAEDGGLRLRQLALLANHKSVGITILALAALRVAWRLVAPPPPLPASMPAWQRRASHVSHWSLYGALFALPLTGWLMSSASAYSVSWFGLFTLPDLIGPAADVKDVFEAIHETLAKLLLALVSIHVLAALKHHFVDRDAVLRRMTSWPGVAALLLVFAGGAAWLAVMPSPPSQSADAPPERAAAADRDPLPQAAATARGTVEAESTSGASDATAPAAAASTGLSTDVEPGGGPPDANGGTPIEPADPGAVSAGPVTEPARRASAAGEGADSASAAGRAPGADAATSAVVAPAAGELASGARSEATSAGAAGRRERPDPDSIARGETGSGSGERAAAAEDRVRDAVPAPPAPWSIDYAQSFIRFTAEQAGAPFTGEWTDWRADIRFDGDALGASGFVVDVRVRGVETRDDERDEVLLDAEWFDAENHPVVTFRTRQFQVRAGGGYNADATMTVKGRTHPVSLRFDIARRGERLELTGAARLDRLALGVGTGEWTDTEWVGRYVDVDVRVVAPVP